VRDGTAATGFDTLTCTPSHCPHGVLMNDLALVAEKDLLEIVAGARRSLGITDAGACVAACRTLCEKYEGRIRLAESDPAQLADLLYLYRKVCAGLDRVVC